MAMTSTGSMPDKRVEALKAMEEGKAEFVEFQFARLSSAGLLAITMEGFFADPIYGGNRNKVSWKMLGFPGPAGDLCQCDRRISRQTLRRRAAIHRGFLIKRRLTW